MAVKFYGSCTGNSGDKYNVWLEVTENSQSITNNTSNVSVSLKLKRNDGYSSSAYNTNESDNNAKITINGVTKVNRNLAIDTRNNVTVLLASWVGNVAHNSDGTLTIAVKGSFSMNGTSLSGGSAEGSFKCITIPRASTFTANKTNVVPNEQINFQISSASNAFTHKLTYETGTYKIINDIKAGVTSGAFTIPSGWANSIPKSKSCTVKVTLTTYNGNSSIGTDVKYLTLTIPQTSEFLPDFAYTIKINGNGVVPENWNIVVRSISTALITVDSVNCKYGAELSTCEITVDSVCKNGVSNVFNLDKFGTVNVCIKISDSRGLEKEIYDVINVEQYKKPSLECNSILRANSNGTPDSSGNSVVIDYSASISSLKGYNSPIVTVKYKKSSATEFSAPLTLTASPFIIRDVFSTTSSYDFVLSISDAITSEPLTISRSISTCSIPFNIRKGGNGAAFGCYAETENELSVGYDLNVKGQIKTEDLTGNVVMNDQYFKAVMLEVKKIECLGLYILKAVISAEKEVPISTRTVVFKITGFSSSFLIELPTRSGKMLLDKNLYVTLDGVGQVSVISDLGLAQGDILSICAVFQN